MYEPMAQCPHCGEGKPLRADATWHNDLARRMRETVPGPLCWECRIAWEHRIDDQADVLLHGWSYFKPE